MATLHELLSLVYRHAEEAGQALPSELQQTIEDEIRSTWPTQRVYVPPINSRKDPSKSTAIRKASKQLPTRVVAERYGVSKSWVHRLVKK